MSRATSAVDIEPDSGVPVVEQAAPNAFDDATYAPVSASPTGNGTFSPARAVACSPRLRKHRTLLLKLVPRGSTPTTSNRSSSAGDRKNDAAAAICTPDPPGPPGLMNRVPILRDGSATDSFSSATSVVALRGWS